MKKPATILAIMLILSAWGGNVTVRPLEMKKKVKNYLSLDVKANSGSYFADSNEKAVSVNKNGTLMIIAGAVIVVAGAGALLLRRRK